MTNRLDINWKLDGFVDEQRYYCSEALIDPNNLPTPKAVLAGDVRTYIDTEIEVGRTYYVRVGSVKNGVEKLSDEVAIDAGDKYATNVIVDLALNQDIIDKKGNIWTQQGPQVFSDESMRINGLDNGVYLKNPLIQDLSEKYTIECYVKLNSYNGVKMPSAEFRSNLIFGTSSVSSSISHLISISGDVGINYGNLAIYRSNSDNNGTLVNLKGTGNPVPLNEFFHIALVYDGRDEVLFLSGVEVLRVNNVTGWNPTTNPLRLGNTQIANHGYRQGGDFNIKKFKITKGIARYTQNFIPEQH